MATLSTTAAGAIWPGAIVGDQPSPFGAADLAAGQFYTTGDIAKGESGEVSGLSALTIEFWYKTPTPTGVAENIMQGPLTTTAGQREWSFIANTGGTISFSARNTTPSSITATSATVIAANTYYHVAGRIDGSFIKLFVNGVEDASTAWTGSIQAFGATAGQLDTIVGSSASTIERFYDEVAIYRSSLGSDRLLAHYQAGAQRGFGYALTPGTHIGWTLDTISSHAPRRIDLGVPFMFPNFYAGNDALTEIQNARAAENIDSTIFISKSGTVTFLDRNHRSSSPYNTTQVTLGDAGGAEIPYQDLGVDYADDTIANEWNVSTIAANLNGATQTASDATSISSYGYRPQAITGLPVTLNSDALTIATAMLAKYKDPVERSNSVALNAELASVAEVVFDRDLGDRIRILRTPPAGGSRIDQTVFIHSIDIAGTPQGPWDVTWGVSPL